MDSEMGLRGEDALEDALEWELAIAFYTLLFSGIKLKIV
jgi:hypothetical protein